MRAWFDTLEVLQRRADAMALVRGGKGYEPLTGFVQFYQTQHGVLVAAEFEGLPTGEGCSAPMFAFHIHEKGDCQPMGEDMFGMTGGHYNPAGCGHPYHAGDMPPLFGAGGRAILLFLSDRFTVQEILGRAVVVHRQPDDFITQPAGNAGEKIACGVIQR